MKVIPFFVLAGLVSASLVAHSRAGEYDGVDSDHQYQKDRSFEALDSKFTAICDGILTSSAKNLKLTVKEEKLLTSFIRQNKLFKEPGFDRVWLDKLKKNLTKLGVEEKNRIAPALLKKTEALYSESRKP